MLKRNLLFWIIPLMLMSCADASQDEDQAVLKQANDIHLEAIKINKTAQPKLEEAIALKNQIEGQEGEKSMEEEKFIKEVAQLEKSYAYWEENHVEVPGFDHHDHDHHDHDHDHDHGPGLEVSAEDMLVIQKEFKDSIIMIQKRLEAITLPTVTQ
ncbi:MAG: hypothetical protein AAGG68_01630 [Bacteroidota bacterium]